MKNILRTMTAMSFLKTITRIFFFVSIIFFIGGWKSPIHLKNNPEEKILVDERDNKAYRIDTINGLWWTLDNAAFNVPGSLCYNLSDSNCQKFGRIYNWEQAVQACPKGWRLPTHQELTALLLPYGKISYSGDDASFKQIFGFYEPEKTDETYKRIVSDKKLNLPVFKENSLDYSNPIQQRTMFWSSDTTGYGSYAIYWDTDGNEGKGAVHFSDYPKDFFGFCRFVKEIEK